MRYAALLLFICCSAPRAGAEPMLNVGYFSLAPHTHSNAALRAPAFCYFDLLAERMQLQVKYHHLPLSRLLKQLADNQLDMALILAKNNERQQQFIYPAEAFFVTKPALAVRPELATDIQRFMQRRDYSIVLWQQGYRSAELNNFPGRTIILTGDNIAGRAVEMLQKGRADAFYEPDMYSLQYELQQYDLTKQLKILPFETDALSLYSVFSTQAAPRYLAAYEKALRAQQAKITYIQYLQKYLLHSAQNPAGAATAHSTISASGCLAS